MPPPFPDLSEHLTPNPAAGTGAAEPDFHVIVENDDVHTFEFVIAVLTKALGCSNEHAFQLALQIHQQGRTVVWTGPRKQAEFKRRLIRLHNEVRHRDDADLGPIGCTVEPAVSA